MGVEFSPCHNCRETICDADDFESCVECGRSWCDYSCGDEDGLKPTRCDDCKTDDEAEEHGCFEPVCGYCRKEMVTDSDLLKYSLELLSISRDKLAEKYLEKVN